MIDVLTAYNFLTNYFVGNAGLMKAAAIQVIQRLDQAAALLVPVRVRLVRELAEPASATALAKRLKLTRQRVNYHLRALEKVKLVRLVKVERRGNCNERIMQATARSYVVSPLALAEMGGDSEVVQDQFSWAFAMNVAMRTLRDLSELRRRADKARKKLATFTMDVGLRFPSPGHLAQFVDELRAAIGTVAVRFGSGSEKDPLFHLTVGTYPAITRANTAEPAAETENQRGRS